MVRIRSGETALRAAVDCGCLTTDVFDMEAGIYPHHSGIDLLVWYLLHGLTVEEIRAAMIFEGGR